MTDDDSLIIAGRSFGSRLLIGTAGYPNQQIMLDAVAASGAELVTVSIRRISLDGYAENLVALLGDRYVMLPNTPGCETTREAVLTAQRTEDHPSHIPSLMRTSDDVICRKK